MEYLVDCIVKLPDGTDTHYAIQELGGPDNGKGARWRASRQRVIDSMVSGHHFYTQDGAIRSYVFIASGPAGEYLRTHTDGTPNDNLLHQPSVESLPIAVTSGDAQHATRR